MRWRSSWPKGDVLFALLLVAIAVAILGLAGVALEAIGRY